MGKKSDHQFMIRACPVSLKFLTAMKRRRLDAMLEAYRAGVNFFIRKMWLEKAAYGQLLIQSLTHTRLPANLRNVACWQASTIVKTARKLAKATKKKVGMPVFRGDAALPQTVVKIEAGKGSFDLIVSISSLQSGRRIVVPTRKTRLLNKWLSMPGAVLGPGCTIKGEKIILFVRIPIHEVQQEGRVLAVDIGINKLMVDSDGKKYGQDAKNIYAKIRRREPGSKGKLRARRERTNLIDREVNRLPWPEIGAIGVEALKNLKFGKSPKRGKSFRKAAAPWTYRHALARIEQLAQTNRVRFVQYCPSYTSQICPMCGKCSAENRKGETFCCIRCGYTADADYVGATNGLARTLQILGGLSSASGFPAPQRVGVEPTHVGVTG